VDDTDFRVLPDLAALERYDTLALAVESEAKDPARPRLLGVALCGEPGRAFWLPADRMDPEGTAAVLRRARLVLHDAKAALTPLQDAGVHLEDAVLFDTMLAAHLLNENRPKDCDALAKEHLGEAVSRSRPGTSQLSLFAGTADLAQFACSAAERVLRLHAVLRPDIERLPTLARLLYDLEIPAMRAVCRMERHGVRLDVEHLSRVGEQYRARMAGLEERIFELAGHRFLLGSPVELARVLYDHLQLPAGRQTRGGQRSVDHATLEALRDAHLVVPLVIEHRELAKLLSTYVEKLPHLVSPTTGRLHCNFNQVGTVTGRFSSNDPNLQNIPKDGTIRSAFVAEEGHVLVDADFSQIELRCVAHYSADPRMVEAFEQGLDLHRKTIADIIGKPIEDVTDAERALAKAVNFGLIYGMGAARLAASTGISLSHAERFIRAYFDTYAGVHRFQEEVRRYVAEHGQIINMYGRRRRFSGGSTRTAFNSLIQSTAADICKAKMVALHRTLPPQARMVLQVHDEILFEVPADEAEVLAAEIVSIMEAPVTDAKGRTFRVPIRVDAGVGRNWSAAKA
jgi:DNA polymerase-1